MKLDLTQISVALVGALAPIILYLVQQRRDLQRQVDGGNIRPAPRPLTIGEATRSYLDLGFMLLFAAFCSLLVSDSLLVSGRAATVTVQLAIAVIVITLVTTALITAMWWLRRSVLGLGVSAITTLAVLLLFENLM